jgi:calcineurin-like phosphoesterase family protein
MIINIPFNQRTFVTSDQHFGHKNIIKYQDRPFNTVEEMDNHYIERWNAVVGPDDFVFHLGDFTLSREPNVVDNYFARLNGKIWLLRGSHDDPNWYYNSNIKFFSKSGYEVVRAGEVVTLELIGWDTNPHNKCVVLHHYAQRVWDRSHYDSYHFFGHSHGNLKGIGYSMDVGADCYDEPIELKQAIKTVTCKLV